MAATFAWARRELVDILSGTAIAVSLMPPLSLVGVAIAALNVEVIRFYLLVFIFNVLGVVIGSLIVFSLLKFHQTEKKVEREVADQEAKQETK